MYFINGSYVQEKEAKISVLDLGLLRGYGVFDYLRTYGGKPFHLWDHLQRLQYSASEIGLDLPYSLKEISEIIDHILVSNKLKEAGIKIIVTGGISSDQFTPQQQSTLVIFAYPLATYPKHCYTEGIPVITTQLARSLPFCKTTQYIPGIVALQKGDKNALEALYLNDRNEILEGTTSNFFGIKNDTLYTCCSDAVLTGITREVVLNLAEKHFPIRLERIHYEEVETLSEAFLTASNKEVMPITKINSQPIGSGTVGPVTQKIMDLFVKYTQQDQWPMLQISRYQLS
jgi:branched-chain amino acid aminotransferase